MATDADVPGVGETIAAAFAEDPVATWAIPDPARRGPVYRDHAVALVEELYLAQGLVHVSVDGTGASIWSPPGAREPDAATRARLIGRIKAAWGEFGDRGAMLNAAAREVHPEETHYYLPFIGVRPEGRGRGVGSALLEVVLDRCDREGAAAYLEATSERNRGLYERHGFEARPAIRLPDGPAVVPMWREPLG